MGCSLSGDLDFFKVGHNKKSETKKAHDKNVIHNQISYLILDTPGTLDAEGDYEN